MLEQRHVTCKKETQKGTQTKHISKNERQDNENYHRTITQ